MMTEHFRTERAERYAFIVTTIGIGKVIHTHKQEYNKWGTDPCTIGITDTGVAIVYTPEGAIVTMYILTRNEALKYYNGTLPMVLEAVIKRNTKRRLQELQNM